MDSHGGARGARASEMGNALDEQRFTPPNIDRGARLHPHVRSRDCVSDYILRNPFRGPPAAAGSRWWPAGRTCTCSRLTLHRATQVVPSATGDARVGRATLFRAVLFLSLLRVVYFIDFRWCARTATLSHSLSLSHRIRAGAAASTLPDARCQACAPPAPLLALPPRARPPLSPPSTGLPPPGLPLPGLLPLTPPPHALPLLLAMRPLSLGYRCPVHYRLVCRHPVPLLNTSLADCT